MSTKTCVKCGEEFEGRRCPECRRAYMRRYLRDYNQRPDRKKRLREYQREYSKRPEVRERRNRRRRERRAAAQE